MDLRVPVPLWRPKCLVVSTDGNTKIVETGGSKVDPFPPLDLSKVGYPSHTEYPSVVTLLVCLLGIRY